MLQLSIISSHYREAVGLIRARQNKELAKKHVLIAMAYAVAFGYENHGALCDLRRLYEELCLKR